MEQHEHTSKPSAPVQTMEDVSATYDIHQRLSQERVLLKRKSDGRIFIGHRFDIDQRADLQPMHELFRRGAGDAAANVLNHENLLCLIGFILNKPVLGGGGATRQENMHMMIWDWCDAGTLENLFEDETEIPVQTADYLPESLVWHVALSMLRALQWLHEGIRETYEGRLTLPHSFDLAHSAGLRVYPTSITTPAEADWLPVLHGEIEARNIYFQDPRGQETYGFCKLGNFSKATVAHKIINSHKPRPNIGHDPMRPENAQGNQPRMIDLPLESPLICTPNVYSSVGEMYHFRNLWKKWDGNGPRPSWPKVYTQATELADLGKVLFQMMTGSKLPPFGRCLTCRCKHLHFDAGHVRTQICRHNCWRDVNVKFELRLRANYSQHLIDAVCDLIKNHDNDDWTQNRASIKYASVFEKHMKWRFPMGNPMLARYDDRDNYNDYGDHGLYRDTFDAVYTSQERKRHVSRAGSRAASQET